MNHPVAILAHNHHINFAVFQIRIVAVRQYMMNLKFRNIVTPAKLALATTLSD
jgi:hypothetical protein